MVIERKVEIEKEEEEEIEEVKEEEIENSDKVNQDPREEKKNGFH